MKSKAVRMFPSLAVFILVVLVMTGGGLSISYNKIPFLQKLVTGVDKTDPDWKMSYCNKELVKIPGPPFTYKKKSDPIRTGPTLYTRKMMPEKLKYSDIATCSFSYTFEEKTAWSSIGVEYTNHIDNANQFKDTSAALFVNSMDAS